MSRLITPSFRYAVVKEQGRTSLNARSAHILPALCYNASHCQTWEVHMEYPIVLEQDPEAGGYVVYCPTLKGCVSQGETEEEALENIKDAIRTYLESIEDLKRLKK